jgi:hypothetical protein
LVHVGSDELRLLLPPLGGTRKSGAARKDLVDDSDRTVYVNRLSCAMGLLDGIELHPVPHRELESRLIEEPAAEIAFVGFEKGRVRAHRTSFTV